MRTWIAPVSSLVLACAAPADRTTPAAPVTSPARPTAPVSAAPARAPAAAGANAPPPAKPVSARAEPKVKFPPADVAPPEERSAQPGDGKWKPLGDAAAGDRAAEGEPVLAQTIVRPHPVSKWFTVRVVAIDLQRTSLHFVAGTEDPKDKSAPKELRTGLVPAEHQDGLIAVFNGGWKTAHGAWGVTVGGHTFLEPKKDGCTIAMYRDNRVRIRSWPELEATAGELRALRQTPPCLVEQAELNPALLAGKDGVWGGKDPKVTTRQRSAVGIDATGKILFYAFGEETGARLLAQGLSAVGAVDAAELDINFAWTRFLLFGKSKKDGKLEVTSTLVPKMMHQKRGYVEKPQPRDFFYLKRG